MARRRHFQVPLSAMPSTIRCTLDHNLFRLALWEDGAHPGTEQIR